MQAATPLRCALKMVECILFRDKGIILKLIETRAKRKSRFQTFRRLSPFALFMCFAVATVAVAQFLYVRFPALRVELTHQERFVQTLTPAMFLAVLPASAVLWPFAKREGRAGRLYFVLAVLGPILCLEEVNYLIYYFGIEPPIIWGKRLDAAHDLLSLIGRILQSGPMGTAFGLALFGSIVAATVRYRWLQRARKLCASRLAYRFILVSAVLGGMGAFIDKHWLEIFYTGPFVVLEEALEMLAGFALFAAPFALSYEDKLSTDSASGPGKATGGAGHRNPLLPAILALIVSTLVVAPAWAWRRSLASRLASTRATTSAPKPVDE